MELGKAYVQIVPSAEGIKGSIKSVLGGEAESAGASGGKSFASSFSSMAGKALKGAGGLLSGAVKAGLNVVGGALKVTGAGIAAAATGISVLGKQAVSAYADFEQLSGGIETLYGKNAPAVMKAANNAFQSAGLSANDYMDTAIQSSAALIASLGGDTKKAASLMDLSITDMADNVNKMGTSMEAVQNAYRGFSRGNFTMLDNLALGFAGTKEGMQQLLDKATKLSGVKYNIGSYSDIVQAIHVVQTEMGITGTTAEEGAKTISGSISTLKAAWSNLLAGLADPNADQSALIANLTTSAKNVVKNLMPVIKTTLKNFGTLAKDLAPVISSELPQLVRNVLPGLIDAAVQLAVGLGSALAENAPGLINSLVSALSANASKLKDVIPIFTEQIPQMVTDVLPGLVDAAVQLALGLGSALSENAPQIISTLVTAIVTNAPKLIEGGIQLVISLVSGLIQSLPEIIEGGARLLGALIDSIVNHLGELLQIGKDLVTGLWNGIESAIGWFGTKIEGWLASIWDSVKSFFGIASPSKEMAWAGEMLAEGLARGIDDAGDDAVAAAQRMNAGVLSAIGGDGFGMNATASSAVEIRHTGTIRVEGVNDRGELVAVTDILYENIVERLRREARYA